MVAPAPEWTVDHACTLLGITRRELIALIGEGRLTWTVSPDRTGVRIQAPEDLEPLKAAIAAGRPAPDVPDHPPHALTLPAAPLSPSQAGTDSAPRRDRPDSGLSDVDAWSQRK